MYKAPAIPIKQHDFTTDAVAFGSATRQHYFHLEARYMLLCLGFFIVAQTTLCGVVIKLLKESGHERVSVDTKPCMHLSLFTRVATVILSHVWPRRSARS